MDPGYLDYLGLPNGLVFQPVADHALPLYSNHDLPNLGNGFGDNNYYSNNNFGEVNFIPFDPLTTSLSSVNSLSAHDDTVHEDYDFSDSILGYITQILMEEDVEGKGCMLQESLEHQAVLEAEKSLYDVIGKEHPSEHDPRINIDSLNPYPLNLYPNIENPCCYFPDINYHSDSNGGECSNSLVDPSCAYGDNNFCGSENIDNRLIGAELYGSIGVNFFQDGFLNSPVGALQVPDMSNESRSISRFLTGFKEASELVPTVAAKGLANVSKELPEKRRHESNVDDLKDGCHSRKHSLQDNVEIGEGSSSKQKASSDSFDLRSEMFDKVLLYHYRDANELIASLRTTLLSASSKKVEQKRHLKGSSSATRGRGKKQRTREEVVDLSTLLTNCAEAVAINDRRNANELLKRIRQHSLSLGDGTQRLAHYVADGLEARLAGTGSEIYMGLTNKRSSAADVLKAYLLYLAACPFRKLSNFFSNKNIAKRIERATKIHIIDFGILYGFQWPSFIQRQSMRDGGPPKIKITGIDFPQPGFRPAERVEETGLRLENYAQEFRVPFEYRAIAKRWDAIQLEEFDIDEDEVVIVSCMYRMKNLPDETMSAESSRNTVLKLIRKLNPEFFVHGVVNGSYNAPFFVTRFREALFHFSAQFDMLETIVPRDYGERVLIERDLLAREALNVIACEGWERVERPETYKQWQARTMRVGFTQLPLDSEIKNRIKMQIRTSYHKDFVVDEDQGWLLLGWKGRIIFALTAWKPN